MELYVTIDLGSSLIKVLYGNDWTKEPNYLAIEPEIIEVPTKPLDEYRRSNFKGNPEDYAFVEVEGKYYAVGRLATKQFRSTTNLMLLKSHYAVEKILAAVWIASEKLGGGKKIKLFLACLLPPGELKGKDALDLKLTAALKSFDTPSGRLEVKLMYFGCYPEGGGLSMHYQKRHPECRDRVLGVVMMGHRNLSAYTVNQGVPDTYKSSDLGFISMVREIQQETSGYADRDISRSVARYLLSNSSYPDPEKHLKELLRRLDATDRQQELAYLIEVIERVVGDHWLKIAAWLTTELAAVNCIVLGGGSCNIFRAQLKVFVLGLPKIIGTPKPISYIDAGWLGSNSIPEDFKSRFADAQCLWHHNLLPVMKKYQKQR
jgi:hypothetical protein